MSDLEVAGVLMLGTRALVRDLRLRAPTGCWTALLGPSGVGKSSMGRLIAGLPVAARLEGRAHLPPPGQVAMLGQDDQLLPWAGALENVTIGARLRGEARDRARAADLLDRVGLAGLHDRRPARLSGGQRQRVALARTLIEDRPVVVLDEPFSALDAGTRLAMQDLAADLLRGRTVILITHDPLEAARLAQRAVLMRPEGCTALPLPDGPAPRPLDDPTVMTAQAALFAALMRPPCAA